MSVVTLRENTKLVDLDLYPGCGDKAPEEALIKIAQVLEVNSRLTCLDVCGHGCPTESREALYIARE